MDKQRLTYLLQQYAADALTAAESEELLRATNAAGATEAIASLMMAEKEGAADVDSLRPFIEKVTAVDKIGAENERENRRAPVRRLWLWAAASIVLLLGLGSYFLLRTYNAETLAENPGPVQNEIGPGRDKAVLTLADGRTIVLDSAGNGALSNQGGTTVMKLSDKLSYQGNGQAQGGETVYNTVATPRGGQYQLILADGTKVWLNAASSLTFPTAFNGSERRVELSGEGYFEVAHNKAMPFHVTVNDMDVQVLGTHFNINGYTDEEAVKTTLLEGRVMVKKGDKSVFLNPGQQAQASSAGETLKIRNGVDVEAAVAWKNGLFQLAGADVKTIGRQIERWYDVEIRYSGNLQSAHLSGEVPRTLNLSQVINVLETSGIEVKTDGRRLTVTPKP